MFKQRIFAIVILIIGVALGAFLRYSPKFPFQLGLDLSGGSHLLYKADVSSLPKGQESSSMEALRDVIERRVNLFGVGEPTVQVQTSALSGATEYRLSVELPTITDTKQAIAMIGQTPFLEFRTQSDAPAKATVGKDGVVNLVAQDNFAPTALTGKYLKKAALEFGPTGEATVQLQFNDEGSALFEKITNDNVGKVVAIYLDGQAISAPVVREKITGGVAVISGKFTPTEARQLVGRLNSGALPVPISLISTQTVGATLGIDAVHAGVRAAVIGFLLVVLFLIVWYRLPGLVAAIALALYVVLTLVLYRILPVTLSAAGIAGFIISIGVAVDANILIFERFREERGAGNKTGDALQAGFDRAWTSIRDANISSLIISTILFTFGSSLIKGFALTLGLGVVISMLSAIVITRILLGALPTMQQSRIGRFLFSTGFNTK